MNQIKDKQQLETAMSELPTEYANKLSAWWCRAQKPGKLYVIEYTDIEDLTRQIDEHTAKASKRSARRKSQPERQQQSLAEQCETVIKELASVYGMTVKEYIKHLQEEIETARASEYEKAETAKREATMKMDAFRAAHPELVQEWETLHKEQQKQLERCTQLHTMCGVAKRGRSKKTEPEQKTKVLF